MKQVNTTNYTESTFTCSQCNTTIETRSTGSQATLIDTCSNCHPAYTGKQRTSVSSNRIDSFNERYRAQ